MLYVYQLYRRVYHISIQYFIISYTFHGRFWSYAFEGTPGDDKTDVFLSFEAGGKTKAEEEQGLSMWFLIQHFEWINIKTKVAHTKSVNPFLSVAKDSMKTTKLSSFNPDTNTHRNRFEIENGRQLCKGEVACQY